MIRIGSANPKLSQFNEKIIKKCTWFAKKQKKLNVKSQN